MPKKKNVKFGLFPKFLFSFIIIAIIPMLVIEFLSYKGMENLREDVVDKSRTIITQLSTTNIRQKAVGTAKQLEVYFKEKRKTSLDKLKNNFYLRSLAVQPVGKTGYTAVHTTEGINIFHKNPKIVGMDLHKLKGRFPEFWKILAESLKGPASGYYSWKDMNGRIRKKYMYCAPVKGTNLVVAATTYLDEFFGPLTTFETSAKKKQKAILLYIFIVFIGFVLFIIVFSYFYAKSVTKPILHLADVADRISVGDLDATVEVKTNDEIMILASAVHRMQKSLRAAIIRLREKRSR
jgi:methyl-accepting chemotaxis protein